MKTWSANGRIDLRAITLSTTEVMVLGGVPAENCLTTKIGTGAEAKSDQP
jgi:hypothetical protein